VTDGLRGKVFLLAIPFIFTSFFPLSPASNRSLLVYFHAPASGAKSALQLLQYR
jgi:hypothetical protein